MAPFPLCAECLAEYRDPTNRRFHAEPNACPQCGPTLACSLGGQALRAEATLRCAVEALKRGEVVAIKALGGYQLAVDGRNAVAVARLREEKKRPHKPFALMARNLEELDRIACVDPSSKKALQSPSAPIVLLPRRAGAGLPEAIAPGLTEVGVMLPSTPLHHLLLNDGPPLLVMTSGNLADEPIAREDGDAHDRLGTLARVLLTHDREIHARADDSVVRCSAGEVRAVRRARGYVPEGLALPVAGREVLAVGGELKNTICLTRGGHAHLSQHIGDLSHPQAYAFFTEVIDRTQALLGVTPEVVAHDLHPDYQSTRWAIESGLLPIGVQHHHAHIASCMAEHGRSEPVLGVAFDGTGCGPSGEIWGGEFLLADLGGFQRLGHLRALHLAGAEAAIRQPWRLAVAALVDAGLTTEGVTGVAPRQRAVVEAMIRKGVLAPVATSAGRWFDAAAALCGVRAEVSYEAQAAVELEALAGEAEGAPYSFRCEGQPFQVDLRPCIVDLCRDLKRGVPLPEISARFHETLAAAIAEGCRQGQRATGVSVVALSGGCFANRRLTERARFRLESLGLTVLLHRQVPPSDGGLALGQAAVAAFRTRQDHVSGDSR